MKKSLLPLLVATFLVTSFSFGAPDKRGPKGDNMETRTWLGVVSGELHPSLTMHLGLSEGFGVQVYQVMKDSPAEAAGITAGDVLLKIGDQKLVSPKQLALLIREMKAGEQTDISLLNKGAEKSITVTVAEKEFPEFRGHHRHRKGSCPECESGKCSSCESSCCGKCGGKGDMVWERDGGKKAKCCGSKGCKDGKCNCTNGECGSEGCKDGKCSCSNGECCGSEKCKDGKCADAETGSGPKEAAPMPVPMKDAPKAKAPKTKGAKTKGPKIKAPNIEADDSAE